ncbi:MAG: phosphotransferase, partial [Flavobacteriaceae bacterium]|nr:phosphotransferase [Flavobacteriaceae bacterium]
MVISTEDYIKLIFSEFSPEEILIIKEFKSGHINHTFYIKTKTSEYVLQSINATVFKNIPKIIENKIRVSKCQQKNKGEYFVLEFYQTLNGEHYIQRGKEFWCLMNFIPESVNYDIPDKHVSFEGGKILSHFLSNLLEEKISDYHVVIPDFHSLRYRKKQYDQAFSSIDTTQIESLSEEIEFIDKHISDLFTIEDQLTSKKIPWRITHNDPKDTNVLFDDYGTALAVIDTDTVMP